MPGGNRGYRDKYNILTFDLYANLPETNDKEQLYICTDVAGQPHAGKIFRGTGTGWVLIPVAAHTHSAYALVDHVHAYAALDHNHDDRYALKVHTHAQYLTDTPVHGHAKHSGVLARGQIGFGGDVGCDLPSGAGAWSEYFAAMEVANTALYAAALHVYCDAAALPSSSVTLVYSRNGVELGSVALNPGSNHALLDIDDIALANGDHLKIAWPADRKGATGIAAYIVIERRGLGA